MTPAECQRCNGFGVVDAGEDELRCDCNERDPQQLARLALAVRAGRVRDRELEASVSRRAPDGAVAELGPHRGFMALILTPRMGTRPSWVFRATKGHSWRYSPIRTSGAVGLDVHELELRERVLIRLPSHLDQRPIPDEWIASPGSAAPLPEDCDLAWRVHDAFVLLDRSTARVRPELDAPTPKAAKPQLGLFDGTGK